ncbi:hypothetical protein F0562_033495 [Nyssa sinensis]|uniref:Uncharacterized protein n=1 Tax=Nyssa sinensis TaxID=561372 RepID=A0A5J5AHU1_9ASTE|nr:hypothetical protein F0562_033495 [Nyssa sinensis]
MSHSSYKDGFTSNFMCSRPYLYVAMAMRSLTVAAIDLRCPLPSSSPSPLPSSSPLPIIAAHCCLELPTTSTFCYSSKLRNKWAMLI